MIESGVSLRLTIGAGLAALPEDGSWLERLIGVSDRRSMLPSAADAIV